MVVILLLPTSLVRADCECGDGETCYWVAPADSNCDEPTATGEYDHPYCGIQNALNEPAVQTGDVLLVLPGVYLESGIDFDNKGVHLRSCAGPEATIVTPSSPPGNGGAIFEIHGAAAEDGVIIEGFTITGGGGGGISCINRTPTIRGNIITYNTAAFGAGIYCRDASPLIIDNLIAYNYTTAGPDGSGGAGIACVDASSPEVVWCTIRCNDASASSGEGGGFYSNNGSDSYPRLTHCTISENQAMSGGAVWVHTVSRINPKSVIDCDDPGLRGPTIDDCLVVGNTAHGDDTAGGAFFFGDGVLARIINCTVANNSCDCTTTWGNEEGGGIHAFHACVFVDNSIFWGNTAEDGPELYVTNGANVLFRYSDVQGGEADVDEESPPNNFSISSGDGNIGDDVEEDNPDFRDSLACDYHLINGSPCIDAADDLSVLPDDLDLDGDGNKGEPTPVDLDGRPRFVGVVDMGTYELGTQGCPEATIAASDPPDGTIDARQPHPIDDGSCGAWQGIGGAAEPIVITLSPAVSGADDPNCWALCETDARGCGANSIASVVDLGAGDYRLILARPITPGAATTIEYLWDGSYLTYIAHPANVDGSGAANANDITALIDCLLDPGTCTEYQEDIDHSGTVNANDITVLLDLLNGAQEFDPWSGTLLPEAEACPSGVVCGCDEGEGGAPEGGGEGGSDGGAEHFPEGFVTYLTNVDLEDPVEAECFPVIVGQLCDMSFRVLSVVERQELGRSLLDPELTFVTPWVEFLVPDIVAFLQSDEGDEQQE